MNEDKLTKAISELKEMADTERDADRKLRLVHMAEIIECVEDERRCESIRRTSELETKKEVVLRIVSRAASALANKRNALVLGDKTRSEHCAGMLDALDSTLGDIGWVRHTAPSGGCFAIPVGSAIWCK